MASAACHQHTLLPPPPPRYKWDLVKSVLKSAAGWQARKLAELQIPSYGEESLCAAELRAGPVRYKGLKGFVNKLKAPKGSRKDLLLTGGGPGGGPGAWQWAAELGGSMLLCAGGPYLCSCRCDVMHGNARMPVCQIASWRCSRTHRHVQTCCGVPLLRRCTWCRRRRERGRRQPRC
jgi:hypothetical protein